MNLRQVEEGKEYIVQDVRVDDEEMAAFLFSLGCYGGEPVTVIKLRRSGAVVAVKDGRYHMARNLLEAISVQEA